jgi:dihydrofolate reductase
MRRVRFNVAASLDGYIAGPNGEYDWIPDDPTVDFAGLFATVDTVLLGRRSYELVRGQGAMPWGPSTRVYVFSSTLRSEDHPGVTIVGQDAATTVSALRAEEGAGEIWLFGGGQLFSRLVAAGQVDAVEVTVVPVLLGAGVPMFPAGAGRTAMTLVHSHVYPSGMVALHYAVTNVSVPMPRAGA